MPKKLKKTYGEKAVENHFTITESNLKYTTEKQVKGSADILKNITKKSVKEKKQLETIESKKMPQE